MSRWNVRDEIPGQNGTFVEEVEGVEIVEEVEGVEIVENCCQRLRLFLSELIMYDSFEISLRRSS
jgi:hypothetical protein